MSKFYQIHEFCPKRTSLRFLILADVDVASTHVLAEKYVPQMPEFDCIVCCGPFRAPVKDLPAASISTSLNTNELNAYHLSEMSSVLAALENIVCRVVYLPEESDPPNSMLGQVHLTPNSVSIYARRISLMQGLFISGYTEVSDLLEELDGVGISAYGTITCGPAETDIDEIIEAGTASMLLADKIAGSAIKTRGIFMLNYAHAHTLNQFLFHKTDILQKAGINICIVPQKNGITFPHRIGTLNIISPPSLVAEKQYVTADLELVDGEWVLKAATIENI